MRDPCDSVRHLAGHSALGSGAVRVVVMLAAIWSPAWAWADDVAAASQTGSESAWHVARWALATNDHQGLPFVVVDKVAAQVLVFQADGRMVGQASALLGLAEGDDAVPGIGNRSLASILPHERTTPAGRFVAHWGRNLKGSEILWVDYDGAVSLHAVVRGVPAERRAQRLSSPSPLDNRISYGCINVPGAFFRGVVGPTFRHSVGVVYVLPERLSLQAVFGPGVPSATDALSAKREP